MLVFVFGYCALRQERRQCIWDNAHFSCSTVLDLEKRLDAGKLVNEKLECSCVSDGSLVAVVGENCLLLTLGYWLTVFFPPWAILTWCFSFIFSLCPHSTQYSNVFLNLCFLNVFFLKVMGMEKILFPLSLQQAFTDLKDFIMTLTFASFGWAPVNSVFSFFLPDVMFF